MKIIKSFYYILVVFLSIGILYAQTPKWVSTEVQKRVAVLEQFPEIKIKPGADGHKMVNKLSKQYPDEFIFINNYYDIDQHNEIVLATDESNLIYTNAIKGIPMPVNLTLLPLGSINRSTDPCAVSRDKWESTALNIMKKNSVVNVYVKPEINFKTRELNVEVEYYYTDDSPSSENYLTVMLLQNGIISYQAGAKEYIPEYAINDTLCIHNHVMRKVISSGGVFGDLITNTKKGSYECRKYTLFLPDSIRTIPLDIDNLEVAAFISESKDNIYTGHISVVEISEDIKVDLSVEDLTNYYNTLKFETIHPKFKVTNNSDMPVTKFDILYTLANTCNTLYIPTLGYIHTKQIYDTVIAKRDTYSGILNKGESIIFEFPEVTRAEYKSASTYISQALVSNIYRNDVLLFNINKSIDTSKINKIGLIDTTFSETEITFEKLDTSLTTTFLPAHTVLDYSLNPYFMLVQDTLGFSYNKKFSGAKNTKSAVLFLLRNIYNVMFKPGYIMFGEVDCKENPNKILSYYYAYSDQMKNATRPRIVVEISKDWGKTWQRVSEKFCDETGKISGTSEIYVPNKSEDYKQVQINLSNNVKENYIVRIGCIPGTDGNALWLDEISITNGPYEESIKEEINLSVYPNPATDILYINNDKLLNEEYEIYDMSGKLIIKDINTTNTINVEQLSTGTYSLKIKDSIFNFIKK